MAEQREENSVLFSLKELRRMEDDRLRREQDERKAREESERKAREDAERRVLEDAERKRRDDDERLRRTEEERLARDREEQLRLGEAERRARVEGEMRLNQERMRLEVQAQKHAKTPWKPILVVAGVILLVAGGVVWKLREDHLADMAAAEAAKQRVAEEARQREEISRVEFDRKVKAMEQDLKAAKTEDEKRRIQERMLLERQREQQRRQAPRREDPGSKPVKVPGIKAPKDYSDDPLKGIKL